MDILFVDERAEEYAPFCTGLTHKVRYESSIPDNVKCDILVASPALASSVLRAGGQPKWIQSTWAGVDSLIPELISRSITLTGIKGIFGQLMSEYVFAYLLADLRDLDHYKSLQSAGIWDDSRLPETLSDKHISIIGTGSIGQHIAKTAKHFRMVTTGVNRSGAEITGFDKIETELALGIQQADYVIACLPETESTQAVFSREAFAQMQPNTLFINVGRGTSVSEPDLTEALEGGVIRSAVLDVFHTEPLPASSPLWSSQRLAITPHISAPSFIKDIAAIFLENLGRFERGESLLYQIDLIKGY